MSGDTLFIVHMLERARRIQRHTQVERAEFMTSEPLQDTAIRGFEVIGEAASRVSDELRTAHPAVPWRRIIGFRNVLIHQYMGVDLNLVWENVTRHLPELIRQLESILTEQGIDPATIGQQ